MKGPLHVIRRRRAERPANGVETAQAATEAPTQAHATADLASTAPTAASDQAPPAAGLASAPPAAGVDREQPAAEVPAGQEPVPARPSFRHRGRLRRRLRYLRRVRELGFRDLGGLVFDQHRFSQVNEALVGGKLAALAAVDAELRALELALDDRRPLTELREPGVSVCSRCGALHGSEASFCPSCGTPVRGPRAIAEVGEAVSLSVGEIGAVTPPATSVPPPTPGTPPPPAQPLVPAPLQLQPLAPMPEPLPEQAPEPAAPVATEPAPAAATSGGEQPASEPTPASAAATSDGEQPAPPSAAAASDGEQPTEVMRPVDGAPAGPDAADGEAEAVGQPTGERRES
jgi:ribosomal protein L40E